MTFELQPHLRGQWIELRPLQEADRAASWAIARDPLLWELHPDKTRAELVGFKRFFDRALASASAFAVVERASGEVVGGTRYYDLELAKREVAIGYTFLSRRCWGGPYNLDMKRLLLNHAFGSVDTVWFHVADMNLRSRRAMEKLGAVLSHHGPRPQNGQLFDFCYYRIDAAQWRRCHV